MPKTVTVTLKAFFEDGKPFEGLLRLRLIRNGVDDHSFIAPRHWMEIPLVQKQEAVFSLIPNARLGSESYYVYQIVSRGFGAERIVQKGIVMVPEHDCFFADLITVEPSADEPEWAAQKAAAEARAWAETAEGCADRACACASEAQVSAEHAGALEARAAEHSAQANNAAVSAAGSAATALTDADRAEAAYNQLYEKEEGLYARMRQIEEYLLALTDGDRTRY